MKNPKISGLCEANGIELFVLFGSHAGARIHPASDVDVAVKPREGVELSKLDLIGLLSDAFDGKEIDLVVLTKDTDPLLLYEVLLRGELLYEGHAGIFEKERLRAWKLYIDTERIRRMRSDYLKGFVEKFGHVA